MNLFHKIPCYDPLLIQMLMHILACLCTCSYPLEEPTSSDLLFDMDTISEALRSSGHDTSRLSAPFIPQPVGLGISLVILISVSHCTCFSQHGFNAHMVLPFDMTDTEL